MASGEPDNRAHGHHVDHPAEIPAKRWRDILLRMKVQLETNRLSITAAGIAFFAFLAIFPALAALVSLYGLFADPMRVQNQLATVQSIMPYEAYTIIENQLEKIVTQPQASLGLGFLGGLLLTLFSANKGVITMIGAMNMVYEHQETRGFFKLNLLSLFYTFVMILMIVISIIFIVIAPAILAFLPLPSSVEALIKYLPWPFLALMIILLLNFTYCFFPNRRRAKWRWITYGSAIASGVWLLASALFSFYASNFGNFNETYGSVGAVVVMMIWFYISAFIVLLGGTLNAAMEHQAAAGSTRGMPNLPGKKETSMADEMREK
jgi:membrane protein